MFEIQPVEVDIPEALPAIQEVRSIFNELVIGGAIRENAMFRIWRMWRDKTYLDITSDNPDEPHRMLFPTFADFVQELCSKLEVSRSKVYTRVKAYSQLDMLGFSEREMITMMSARPSLYEKALGMIFEWDQEIPGPTGFKTDFFGEEMNDESISRVKRFIEELADHESVQDALSYLKHDIMGKPEVRIIYDRDISNFKIEYSEAIVESSGNVVTMSPEIWSPGEQLPDWVLDEISKKYRIAIY